MASGLNAEQFRQRLLGWFEENARDLPWRRSRDPYGIWVSEIMLQQTRVAAVLEHYARFMRRFPALEDLAGASETEVLAHWSGLGYYRRARMLHRAAQFAAEKLEGRLPENAAGLRALPGVGEYTAAAVASIGFGEPVACVDGNVERVLRRLSGCDERSMTTAKLRAQAAQLLDPARPGDFNQAMMELGATVCLPRAPLCLHCPVCEFCATRGEQAATARKKMRSQESAYAFLSRAPRPLRTEVLLEQRPADSSVMPGMWELPAIAPDSALEEDKALTLRHSITDTNYYVSVYRLNAKEERRLPKRDRPRQWHRVRDLRTLPLTGLTRKVLMRLHAWPGYDGDGPAIALGPIRREIPV